MKRISTLAILIATLQLAVAQAPQGINYQAVARNSSGNVLANTFISLRLTIQDGNNPGTPDYQETDTATTNQFGLFTVVIGNGAVVSGTFAGIVWSTGNKYLRVELDPTGGSNYVIMGTSALQSVPYALFAGNGGVGTGWNLSGNTGTTYGTSFIGTADSVSLMFKVNDTVSGRIETPATGNTSFGYGALYFNTATQNTAIGQRALNANTTGAANTAVGKGALHNNTTGNTNVAVGINALFLDSTGNYNTAVGGAALYNNNTGVGNTAVGHEALFLSTSGGKNTATGQFALYNNTTGYSNVAMGISALYSNATLSNQVAIGDSSLYSLNGGVGSNTAIGSKALFSNTTGDNNTALGYLALTANITGGRNTSLGSYALENTIAYANIGVGYGALQSNTSGYSNVAMGNGALYQSTNLSYQVAIGDSALYNCNNNSGGGYNTAVGALSLFTNTGGSYNAVVGEQALYLNTTGNYNTAMGLGTMFHNTTGEFNTGLGAQALADNTTGRSNTVIGSSAFESNTTGNYNTALGSGTDVSSGNLTNTTAIGAYAYAAQSNTIVLGSIAGTNFAPASVNVGIGTNTPVAILDINAGTGHKALHISGLTNGSGSDNVLTINATTGIVDSIHLLHYIGEHYGGGIVFYVWDNGMHGLVSDTIDVPASPMKWYNDSNRVTGAFRDGIGGGAMNTNLIISTQIGDHPTNAYFAALACQFAKGVAVNGNYYSDWYLPSLTELNLLYLEEAVVGNFTFGFYWSSTEQQAVNNEVQCVSFNLGVNYNETKNNVYSVRAIRQF